MRKRKTPYQRIARAAERGTGVRLSYDDVFLLSMDDAIMTRAMNDDESDEGSANTDYIRPEVRGSGEGTVIVWKQPDAKEGN